MGFMDKLKGLFGGHKDQVDQGIDKGAEAVKEKVPDEHDDKVDAVADKAHGVVDDLTDSTPADSAPAVPASPPPADSAPAAPTDPAPADSAPAAPADTESAP